MLAAIEAAPGITYAELGVALGVSKDTAARYVAALGDRVDDREGHRQERPGASMRLYAIAASPHVAAQAEYGDSAATCGGSGVDARGVAASPQHYIGAASVRRPAADEKTIL